MEHCCLWEERWTSVEPAQASLSNAMESWGAREGGALFFSPRFRSRAQGPVAASRHRRWPYPAGVATAAAGIAKILFYIFLIIFLVTLIMGLAGRGRTRV